MANAGVSFSPERWKRVDEIFTAAADMTPEDSRAFVRNACGDDVEIESEVLRLLALDRRDSNEWDRPILRLPPRRAEADAPLLAYDDLIGERFRIVRYIGGGGMGQVYEAADLVLNGERVALKVLRPDVEDADRRAKRLRREVQLARRVTHPSVCRIHDIVVHRSADGHDLLVLTMQLLRGETLAERLRRGPMEIAEALAIAEQLGAALDAAHEQQVLHRDLKPGNIILEPHEDGRVRAMLTDFGLARTIRPGDELTLSSHVSGTPPYLAPELRLGAPPTRASDLYAFALVICEMVTGALPARALFGEPSMPSGSSSAGPPAHWITALRRALDPDPSRRFGSVAQLLDALRRPQPARQWTSGLRSWAAYGAAALVIGVMTLASAASRFRGQELAIVPPASHMLLTDIVNGTGDQDLDGATEVLRSQLVQSPHFQLIAGDRVTAALARMRRPPATRLDPEVAREIALREAAPIVAYATMTKLADEYVLNVRLERVGTHPSSVRGSWTRTFSAAGKGHVFETLHDGAAWIRRTVGETPAQLAAEDRPPSDTTTSSWTALKLYGQANALAAQGRNTEAVLLLQDALRYDAGFATAHTRLGDLLVSLKRDREAFKEWREAIRLADEQQLTTRESRRIRAQYLDDSGDFEAAEAAYRTYLVQFSNDYRQTVFLATLLADRGRTAEALEKFRTATEMQATDYVVPTHLARLLLDQGRFDEAAAEIGRVRAAGQPEWATWLEALTAFVQGDAARAMQRLEPLRTSHDPEWVSRAHSLMASLAMDRGAHAQAERELRDGVRFDQSHGFRGREADKWLALATLQCETTRLAECRASAQRALDTEANTHRVMRAGTLLARMGQAAEAERLLRYYDDQPDIPKVQAAVKRLRGEILFARGQRAGAVRLLAEAARQWPERFETVYLARARRLTGDLEGADRALADFVAHPVRAYFVTEPEFPGIWRAALSEYVEIRRARGLDVEPYATQLAALKPPTHPT